MGESVGVQLGRACPGLPKFDDFRQAERGVIALGGCLMSGEMAAFVCRTCDLPWESESAPTADEAELADLLGVGFADVVRAVGTG